MMTLRPLILMLAFAFGVLFSAPAARAGGAAVLKVDTSQFPIARIYVQSPHQPWPGGRADVVFQEPIPADTLDAIRWSEGSRASDPAWALPVIAEPDNTVADRNVLAWRDQHDPAEGRLLLFLVDASGSMNGTPMREVRDLIGGVMARLRPEDKVIIARFADQLEDATLMGATSAEARAAVERLAVLRGQRSTKIHDALAAGIERYVRGLEEPALAGRRFFFVFSDGLDRGSAIKVEDLQAELARIQNAPVVFSVGVGTSGDDTRFEDLKRLAFRGTGEFLSRVTPQQLADRFDSRSTALEEQLLVEVDFPAWYHRKGRHAVELVLRPTGADEVVVPLTLDVSQIPATAAQTRVAYDAGVEAVTSAWRKHTGLKKNLWIGGAAGGGVLVVLGVGLVVVRARRRASAQQAAQMEQIYDQLRNQQEEAQASRQDMERRLEREKQESMRAADAARKPLALLLAVDGPLKGQRFGVLQARAVAGRDPERCDVVFPSTQGDPAMSRVHAQFSLEQGSWFVTCLSDGVLVVGQTAVRKGESYPIRIGDRLMLGKTLFVFQNA